MTTETSSTDTVQAAREAAVARVEQTNPVLETAIAATQAAKPPAPPPVVMANKDDARARFLRTRKLKFELAVIDGAEVALVVPPEGIRGEIQQLALDVDKSGKVRPGNAKKRQALTIIAMVHTIITEPTTGEKRPGAKVFADADLTWMLGPDAGSGPESVISMFGPACDGVLERSDAGTLEAAKNG